MYERKRTIGAAGRVAAIFLGAIIFAAVLPCGGLAATQKGDGAVDERRGVAEGNPRTDVGAGPTAPAMHAPVS